MKQAVLLVVVFLCCLSFKEGSSKENCPNAKISLKKDEFEFYCLEETEDMCYIKMYSIFDVDFYVDIPEEAVSALYEVLLTGDAINATASGKADMDKENNLVILSAFLEGDLTEEHNGTATVKIFYRTTENENNELDKDNPDYCVRTNITVRSKQ